MSLKITVKFKIKIKCPKKEVIQKINLQITQVRFKNKNKKLKIANNNNKINNYNKRSKINKLNKKNHYKKLKKIHKIIRIRNNLRRKKEDYLDSLEKNDK
jgi:hypothetical protein